MDSTSFIFAIIIMVVIDILVITTIMYVYRKEDRKFIQSCANEISSLFESYKIQLETQNKILTNDLINTIKSHEKSLEGHRHIDKELFTTFNRIKQAIKAYFYDTATSINASRLAIYLFHNGQSSTHGFSFVKMSCICEKITIGSGVRERFMEHSNIPINLFDEMVDELSTNGKYIVVNNEKECSETVRRLFISSPKIQYAQLVSVLDNDNNILGFICAEMSNDYSRESALKEKQKIDELINQIRPVLSYSDYVQVTLETNPSNVQHG